MSYFAIVYYFAFEGFAGRKRKNDVEGDITGGWSRTIWPQVSGIR